MNSIPLGFKRKVSTALHWMKIKFVAGALLVTMAAGFGGVLGAEKRGAADPVVQNREKIALQADVKHLMTSYDAARNAQSLADAVTVTPGILALAHIDTAKLIEENERLKPAFNAELEKTAVELATARNLSAADLYALYTPLQDIKPQKDFVESTGGGMEAFLLFRLAQREVMSRPGFAPSVASAREIVARTDRLEAETLLVLPAIFSLALLGGLCLRPLRRRVDASIAGDEAVIHAAKAAEKLAQPAKIAAAVNAGTSCDIKVKPLKLASKT